MRFLVTGGAGYIGSLLSATLLREGHEVTVVDKLFFGGDPLLPLLVYPGFRFRQLDVTESDLGPLLENVQAVYHLAALVGFPACQDAGEPVSYRFNVEATRRVFEAAERAGVERFIFASTYSNYGLARDGTPVTEESELYPQSLYAKTKIAAEEYLLGRAATSRCAPVIPRFTTLFGVSPRTRFDLLVNQFVLEALTQRKLILFQGNYTRSFVHIRDVVRALLLLAYAPVALVRAEVFNIGHDEGNYTKAQIVEHVCGAISGVEVEYRDLSFGGDMRDVAVSCRKIRERLGFEAGISVQEGVLEVRDAIQSGLIKEPLSDRYRNHRFIVH